jgi:replication-associated recombination protein RarA
MTSFIILSRDKDKRIAYAKEFCAKHDINNFDITLIEKDNTVKQNVSSIGIDDIKRIRKTVFLKPLQSTFKAVIIEDAQLLTTEAQNALLKVLEEPPEHTLLLLGTDTKDSLLPTIISRCQIITLKTETLELASRERHAITQFITELSEMSIGERLKKAESLSKDKDKAVDWIEKVIIVMREQLIHHSEALPKNPTEVRSFANTQDDILLMHYHHQIKSFQSLHTLLKTTNTNPRFAIENTLLNL